MMEKSNKKLLESDLRDSKGAVYSFLICVLFWVLVATLSR
jgi:hypothetical protein